MINIKINNGTEERTFQPHRGALKEARHHPDMARKRTWYELQHHKRIRL